MARGDFPSSKQDQFVLRFPDGLRDRVKNAAQRNRRSMNAEIIAALEYGLEAEGLVIKLRERQNHLEVENTSLREMVKLLHDVLQNGTPDQRQFMEDLRAGKYWLSPTEVDTE